MKLKLNQKVLAAMVLAGIFAWCLSLVTLIASMWWALPIQVIGYATILVVVGIAVYLTIFIMAIIAMRGQVL